jgi:phosphonate metabolism protein PhnN/1,5-bisphosphokinase (PRPP-forming)
MPAFPGYLVLVVGPSGAGKDSLIRAASRQFSDDPDFVFPRRIVTRKAHENVEDHATLSEMEFALAVAGRSFSLWWDAHGHLYGLSATIEDDLAAGRVVIINCSRSVLAEAVDRYPHVVIVEVTAPREVLVSRIVARGRENEAEALARVSREVPAHPAGAPVIRIVNDQALEDAEDSFCAALVSLQQALANPGRDAFDDEHEQEDGDDDGRGLVIIKEL